MYCNPKVRYYYLLCMVEKTEAMKATENWASSHGYLLKNQEAILETWIQSLNNFIYTAHSPQIMMRRTWEFQIIKTSIGKSGQGACIIFFSLL